MFYAIIDSATNRLINFTNIPVNYDGCYFIEQDFDLALLGKKYENGGWVDSSEPYQSEHGKWVQSVRPDLVYTAEQWLAKEGYSSVRLITLMDVENKLAANNKDSQKLSEVRSWINTILSEFVLDSQPKSAWASAPHSFQETIDEAFTALNT